MAIHDSTHSPHPMQPRPRPGLSRCDPLYSRRRRDNPPRLYWATYLRCRPSGGKVNHYVVICGLFCLGLVGPSLATEPRAALKGELIGHTLSAVAYVARAAGSGAGGNLQRIMLQAYLAADGSALVREWDPARNSYTRPARTSWSLSNTRLCIELPSRQLCADIHTWAPRIAGIGGQPYAMLDGDLQPGNAMTGVR